jgi:nitrite reductase/ring-hydroxylating ferredoxin subunit
VVADADAVFEGWYPVGTGESVQPGQVIGVDFADLRVAVFRDEHGQLGAIDAQCCHLGADLALGRVVGADLRCPFHHWSFDARGCCTDIPATDRIPAAARQESFPVRDELGLIWTYRGRSPGALPFLRGPNSAAAHRYKTGRIQVFEQPPWLVVGNAIDVQHITTLHGMRLLEDPSVRFFDDRVEFDIRSTLPVVGEVQQFSTIFGVNAFTMTGGIAGLDLATVAAGRPIGGGRSEFFFVAAVEETTDPALDERLLALGLAGIEGFLLQDLPVLNTLRFRLGVTVAADRPLLRYFDYVARSPRASDDNDPQRLEVES